MTLMLPAAPAHARSITGVASDLLASLSGTGSFGPARSVVLCVIDGLGALQLRAHPGHARRLSAMMRRRDVARSVFPSTTAAALTSLLTGADPGRHGLVGYRVLDPETDNLVNQLSGWEREGIDPQTWQSAPTMFEQAVTQGRAAFAVGPSEYDGSGFTRAVLRGAEYVSEDYTTDRVARAVDLANRNSGSVVYCYLPEVDKAGHKYGVASDQWLAALEEVDAAFMVSYPDDVGVIVTADHGMIDVPRFRHVLLGDDDPRWDGVSQVGGEPRMLHVYTEPGADVAAVVGRWQDAAGTTASIITRSEAIAQGLFGDVSSVVAPRIGDVLVVTRGIWAYYDDRGHDTRAQKMIGQHGSVSPEETIVPLLRAGAFA